MQPANVVGAGLLVAGALIGAAPVQAQTELSVDLGLYSSYVWRGLSLTNKPVAQPAVYLTFPAGNASITLGGWSTIDLGQYDDLNDDISESGGSSAFNLAEFDPIIEVSFPVGKATLTAGGTAYIYPNDENATRFGLLTSDNNTIEVYGKAEFDAPLSPALSIYYDVDKINGLYAEGAVSHSLPIGASTTLDLGALAGVNAGQGVPDDLDESFNFADDGFTHLDLSAGVPFTAGAFSITPVVHFVVAGDDFVKITSPTDESDVKLWGGVTISWARTLGAAPPEAE